MFVSFLFVAILWQCFKTHAFNIGDLVDTTSGRVQGKASALRPDVSEYLGIPYAEPPLATYVLLLLWLSMHQIKLLTQPLM